MRTSLPGVGPMTAPGPEGRVARRSSTAGDGRTAGELGVGQSRIVVKQSGW